MMAITAAVIGAVSAITSAAVSVKTGRDRRQEEARRAKEARIRALGEKQQFAAGKALAGQGGSGTLLTGAGGLADPALTGKQTLLGTR